MMKTQTYLMSFSQMIELLRESGHVVSQSQIMDLRAVQYRLYCNGELVILSNDLFEKLNGTWWEVKLNAQSIVPECNYLADSLQDALRLRPQIDTTYWCGPSANQIEYLSEVMEWVEDECLVD